MQHKTNLNGETTMMKAEFIDLVQGLEGPDPTTTYNNLSEETYQVIETVYNYHPAIKDKAHCAKLYHDYGVSVFYDMLDRAEKLELYKTKIQEHKLEIAKLEEEIDNVMTDRHI